MITKKSPTRVDLAGGTLDCWPLYLLIGDCKTINLSIDIFTGVELEPREDKHIRLIIDDLGYDREYENLNDVLRSQDEELTLVKPHLEYWNPTQGLKLKTYSESPVGGGLGGSSSLCISLLKSFSQWLNKPLAINEMVHIASNIEAKILKTPTGTQDYFPAANPGLSVIHYGVEGYCQESLDVSFSDLGNHLLLVNTGKAHHSGINNWQVLKAAVEGDFKTLENLREIAQIAQETEQICRDEQWDQLPTVFEKEFIARTKLCDSFTSPEIEQLQKLSLQGGASAVKICGAGGGGCVLVWTPVENREKVANICRENGFQVLPIQPVQKV